VGEFTTGRRKLAKQVRTGGTVEPTWETTSLDLMQQLMTDLEIQAKPQRTV
jgi:hypothetical protein